MLLENDSAAVEFEARPSPHLLPIRCEPGIEELILIQFNSSFNRSWLKLLANSAYSLIQRLSNGNGGNWCSGKWYKCLGSVWAIINRNRCIVSLQNVDMNASEKSPQKRGADINYGIDDAPPWYLSIFMALQVWTSLLCQATCHESVINDVNRQEYYK